MKLTKSMQDFILHWGEMGTRWGINRTVSQVFALLYLAEKPLHAEEIAETLHIARSNVSTSLRELESWGILITVTTFGDRKEYFKTLDDIWAMFRIIITERKKREIDPTLSVLRECMITAEEENNVDDHANKRLKEIHDFFVVATAWYDQMNRLSTDKLVRGLKAGEKLAKFFGQATGEK